MPSNYEDIETMALRSAAAAALVCADGEVILSRLYQGALTDSTLVILATQARKSANARRVVIIRSPEQAPNAAREAAERAQNTASVLGPQLSKRIAVPIVIGYVGRRSYSIVPYLESLTERRPICWLQRRMLQPVLFDWLAGCLVKSGVYCPDYSISVEYAEPLKALMNACARGSVIHRAAAKACGRLEDGSWLPMQCLMHGDLWRGNLMLRPDAALVPKWPERLMLIDWAGSRLDGYPFFDLTVAADSLRAPARLTRKEFLRHSKLLGCQPEDSAGYVLAAVGAFFLRPGFAPVAKLLELADKAYAIVRRVSQ